jgi:transcriptional regulator of aromatic amino acid metabolism
MVDFSTLTPENINMFAIKHYSNPSCVDEKEFLDDMKRFKYLKRLFRKYDTSKDLKMRLIINHWSILKTFLIFLHYMPENDLVEVPINHQVMGKLGQI